MRIKRTFTALGAFFVLAVGVAACGGGIPGNAVAVMAGNPVTTAAFNHWMYVAAKGNSTQSVGAPVIVPNDPPDFESCIKQVREQIPTLAKTPDSQIRTDCNELFTSLSSQVMNFLITSYWYQAQAAKLGITVKPSEITQALDTAKKQEFPTAATFNAFLAETGQTLDDINYRLRISKLYTKLLAHYTKQVTPSQVNVYFHAHPTSFGTPETRNLRIVRTSTEAQANAAAAALKAGQSWTVVAKQYSVDAATKDDGGQLIGVTNGEEEHALNVVAFSAPVGKVLGPIHGTFGWYVVEVTKITPGTTESLATATTQIKKILLSAAQASAQAELTKDIKTNWAGQTSCRQYYEMALCSNYTAPSTTTTTTPATSTPTTGATTTPSTTTPSTTTPTTTSTTTTSGSSSSSSTG